MTPTPYEIQIKGERGWASTATLGCPTKARSEFIAMVARSEGEGRTQSFRLIERRGRGETILAISEYKALPIAEDRTAAARLAVAERVEKAQSDSAARVNIMGEAEARTKYLKARKAARKAEAKWNRHPTRFTALMFRAALELQAEALDAIVEY